MSIHLSPRQFLPCRLSFVNSGVLTPDAQNVITASADKTLRVWDLETGNLIHTQQAHSSSVESVAISNTGRILVSAGGNGEIKVWELLITQKPSNTGKQNQNNNEHNNIVSLKHKPVHTAPESSSSGSNLYSQQENNPITHPVKETQYQSIQNHNYQQKSLSKEIKNTVDEFYRFIEKCQKLLNYNNLIESHANEINLIINTADLDSTQPRINIGQRLQLIAEILFDCAEYKMASDCFLIATKFDYENADQYLAQKGNLFFGLKNFDSAEQAYCESLAINSGNWVALLGQSAINAHRGQLSKALELIETATRLAPEEYELWTQKGVLLFQSNKANEALKALDKALALSPNNPVILENKENIVKYLRKIKH